MTYRRGMSTAVKLESVSVVRDERRILDSVSWTIEDGERWVVLGPNGSGKTTILRILGAQMHPTSGDAWILHKQLGHTDVRVLRKRIGIVSGSVIRSLRVDIAVEDVVMSGRRSALETWWDEYDDDDHRATDDALKANGIAHLRHQTFNVISEGERQKVLLARALVTSPGLLLLDEPFAGLDLGNRERLLTRMRALFSDPSTPPLVLVTEGRVVRAGSIEETLTSHYVSEAFDLDIRVRRDENGRWSSTVG
jgi:iron complex transport system ATP-binding protein